MDTKRLLLPPTLGPGPPQLTPRKPRPVVLWATIGAFFLLLEAYVLTAWVLSGKATRTDVGTTPVPLYMKAILGALQVASPILLIVFLHIFLVRPWRRQGWISSDGLLCLVFGALWWQDPILDSVGPVFTYNSYFVNFGSWLTNVPGVTFPNGNKIGVPLLMTCPLYVWGVFGLAVFVNLITRRLHTLRPRLSKFGLIAITYALCAALVLTLEPLLQLAGYWSWTGTVSSLTLFRDHYYRFPIYETFIAGGLFAAIACLRYFRDDKGYTVVERGVDKLRISPRRQPLIRFLALSGVCNVLMIFAYAVPHQLFALNMESPPEDLLRRSYLMQEICGADTTYACPGPGVPLPRRDSARIGPDGQLVPARTKVQGGD